MEVLVALVVLGMLLAGLTRGIRLGIEAWNTQSRITTLRDQLDDTDRAIRLLLSRVQPSDETETVPIAGSATSFRFTTELPSAVALACRRVNANLFVDAQHRLILSWSLHLHEQSFQASPPATRTELLSGVQRIDFQYWHAKVEGGPAAGWVDRWDGANPPALIKVHLAFPKGDGRLWPDIVVAPEIDRPVE